MEDNDMREGVFVELEPGWPIICRQDVIFSEITDAQFRILCAYLARDKGNKEAFDELMSKYPTDYVVEVLQWARETGITRNG